MKYHPPFFSAAMHTEELSTADIVDEIYKKYQDIG